jgi:hypothetical protein
LTIASPGLSVDAAVSDTPVVVEHAGSPPAGGVAPLGQGLAAAPLQYEGFEPSPYAADDPRAQAELLAVR